MKHFYIRIILLFLVSTVPCNYNFSMGGFGPMPGPGQMPMQMSPDDMKMLEQVDKEINDYVNSLSPEEQKKFWGDVEELTNEMNNMNPEELEGFMNQVFEGEDPGAPKAKPTAKSSTGAPTSKKTTKAEPKTPKVEIAPSKINAALRIIDTILARIENFNTKITPIPDIDARITRWGSTRKIGNWPAGAKWNTFKVELDNFVKELQKLKSRDTKTNTYKFLDAFIKDEALYNNLAKVSSNLSAHTSNIETVPLGALSIPAKSKQAIQASVSDLAEAFYILNVRDSLTQVFATYDTVAQEVKKKEDEERKRALRETKRKPRRMRTKVAGRGERSFGYGDFGDYDFGDDYGDYGGYGGGYGGYGRSPYGRGSYGRRGYGRRGTGKRSARRPSPAKKPGQQKPSQELAEALKDKRSERIIAKFDEQFDNAVTSLESIPWIITKEIKEHVINPDTNVVSIQFAQETLPSAISNFRQATSSIGGIKIRSKTQLTKQQSEHYRNQFLNSADYHKPFLQDIVRQINEIENKWPSLKSQIPDSRRYAYFGGKDVEILKKAQSIEQVTNEIEHRKESSIDAIKLKYEGEIAKFDTKKLSEEELQKKELELRQKYQEEIRTITLDAQKETAKVPRLSSEELRAKEAIDQLKSRIPEPASLFALKDAIDGLLKAVSSLKQRK